MRNSKEKIKALVPMDGVVLHPPLLGRKLPPPATTPFVSRLQQEYDVKAICTIQAWLATWLFFGTWEGYGWQGVTERIQAAMAAVGAKAAFVALCGHSSDVLARATVPLDKLLERAQAVGFPTTLVMPSTAIVNTLGYIWEISSNAGSLYLSYNPSWALGEGMIGAAVQKLQLPPAKTVYISNNEEDKAMARKAGIGFVLI